MAAITVTDLNNAKLDVDHIAAIAISPELTAVDRMGNEKETIAGLSLRFPESYSNAAAAAESASEAKAARDEAVAATEYDTASLAVYNSIRLAAGVI